MSQAGDHCDEISNSWKNALRGKQLTADIGLSGRVVDGNGTAAFGLNTPQFIAKPFFDPASEALRFLPEGPRVLQQYPGHGGGGRKLGWLGIQHAAGTVQGSINVLDVQSRSNRTIPLPGRPGFFAETTRAGVVLIGLERRLVFCKLTTGEVEETGITVTDDERVIINDGLPIHGGVLFGTKHLECSQPVAALYFFDACSRKVRMLIGGQTCSNGKFLRRDAEGFTLIDIDSTPKAIHRYQFDAKLEHVISQSLVVEPGSLPAFPDGLRSSPDGESVIVAFYDSGVIADGLARQMHIGNGKVLCEWRIPGSPRVTCPEFVELEGKVKVIFTTAVEGMPDETRRLAPGAGKLFIADTPFGNMPEPPPLLDV